MTKNNYSAVLAFFLFLKDMFLHSLSSSLHDVHKYLVANEVAGFFLLLYTYKNHNDDNVLKRFKGLGKALGVSSPPLLLLCSRFSK